MSNSTNPFAKPRGQKKKKPPKENFWRTLSERINDKKVIPIISSAVRNNRILDIDYDYKLGISIDRNTGEHINEFTITEKLAQGWAWEIGYPLKDNHQMARVANYNRVKSIDDEQAKQEYLAFLKSALLRVAEGDKEVEDILEDLKGEDLAGISFWDMDDEHLQEKLHNLLASHTFSEIAYELHYPKFTKQHKDPLDFLAKLPLPLYVTTSCHDFMERALRDAKRTPRTKICFWFGEPTKYLHEDHAPKPGLDLDPERPIVYHLFGYEDYPSSLIISEDDYLDFLVKAAEESQESKNPTIPLELSAALTESSLILLGYQLQDWDFKVLFRGIIGVKPDSLRKFNLAIQLDPALQQQVENNEDKDEAQNYLRKYFAPSFSVEWGTTEKFIEKLWEEWNKWRKSQA